MFDELINARCLGTLELAAYTCMAFLCDNILLVRWASTHYDPIQIKQLVQEAVTLTNQNQQSAPPMKQLELQISDLERESSDPSQQPTKSIREFTTLSQFTTLGTTETVGRMERRFACRHGNGTRRFRV
jgi:hypothetical protein